jgi:fibronectin type 3 domain-containing protein
MSNRLTLKQRSNDLNKKPRRALYKGLIVFGAFTLCALAVLSFNRGTVQAACASPTTSYGTDTMSVSVPASTTYNIWVRMQAPSTTANTVLLQVDGNTCYSVEDTGAVNTLNWINDANGSSTDAMQLSLTQGAHSIELIGNAADVSVDRIELLANLSCGPSGNGNNCAPTSVAAPTVSFTSPTSGSTVSGTTVAIAANAASAPGVTQVSLNSVVFAVDGKTIATDTTSPYGATWNSTAVSNGTHTLTATATDSQGQSTTATESIAVNNTATVTAPNPPTNVVATDVNSGQVNLTWTASTDTSTTASVAGYYILRSTDGTTGGPYTKINYSTGTSFQDTTVSPDTSYTYEVEAYDNSTPVNTSKASTPSNVVAVPPVVNTTPPSIPTGLQATATSTSQINLTWDVSTDNSGTLAGYYVLRSTSSTGPFTTVNQTTTNSYQDTGLTASTTYYYEVKSFDTNIPANVSKASTQSSATTFNPVVTTPPTPPTNLMATAVSSSQINLTWDVSTATGGIRGYQVYRISGSSTSAVLINTVTATGYGDTGLSALTEYSYYVVAVGSTGIHSQPSATVGARTGLNLSVVTVYGSVTKAGTHFRPLAGINIATAAADSTSGAQRATTNQNGIYLLTNIIPNQTNTYLYWHRGFHPQAVIVYQKAGVHAQNIRLVVWKN